MKKTYFLIKILFIFSFSIQAGIAAKSGYFYKGKTLFENKEFSKSKFFFERDIVFNPKSEKSYLYLAKIFSKNEDNDEEQEKNLNSVLLLNPKNDEAIYMLTLLKIKQSNYAEAKELISKFNLVCELYCSKKNELNEKFDKIVP